MKSITDFQTIVLVSLSVVMSVSVIASYLGLSIPLAVVSAGLFMGKQDDNIDEKERSHEALEKFWQLIDEMLNTILFVMIGLQMVNLPYITQLLVNRRNCYYTYFDSPLVKYFAAANFSAPYVER